MSRAAHHLLDGPVRGWGLKAGDDETIPLCHEPHHGELHRNGDETAYLEAHGVKDAPGLAKALYEATGDYTAMLAALAENIK